MATKRRTGNKNSNKKNGCLIWLIPLFLGLILILTNQEVLESISNFFWNITASGNQKGTSHRPERNPGLINRIISQDMQTRERENIQLIRKQLRQRGRQPAAGRPKLNTPPSPLTFAATLYFVRYDASGDRIRLIPVTRTIRKTRTPAYTVLTTLLRGPGGTERGRGLSSLIPADTRLRKLHLKRRTLYIDLNTAFIQNQKFGKEGLILQIYQIVNSMCRFPTISSVRFTIEGRTLKAANGDRVKLDKIFYPKLRPLS